MAPVSLLGVVFLASLVDMAESLSSAELDNLTSIISLTASNIDEQIAKKHHFVLFYAAG